MWEPVERVPAPVESVASIEETYMEDIIQRLNELFPTGQPGENEPAEGFDEERY